jgi:hypothetical protein
MDLHPFRQCLIKGTLQGRGVALVLANVNEQPLSLIRRSGFEQVLGPDHIVPTVTEAMLSQQPSQ